MWLIDKVKSFFQKSTTTSIKTYTLKDVNAVFTFKDGSRVKFTFKPLFMRNPWPKPGAKVTDGSEEFQIYLGLIKTHGFVNTKTSKDVPIKYRYLPIEDIVDVRATMNPVTYNEYVTEYYDAPINGGYYIDCDVRVVRLEPDGSQGECVFRRTPGLSY